MNTKLNNLTICVTKLNFSKASFLLLLIILYWTKLELSTVYLLMYSDWLLFNTSNHVWSLLWICSSRILLFFSAAVVVNIWEVPLGNFLSHLVFLLYSSHPLSAPNSAICYTFFPPPLCSALASSHPTPTSLSVSLHLPTTQSLQCLGMELSPQEQVRTLKGEGG